jgi:hypothetical protein
MSFAHSPKIVTDGLVLSLDAGNTKSYPGSGTAWFDKSGFSNNGTLTNGPTFNSANLGSIVFDGVDDSVTVPNGNTFFSGRSQVTVCVWFRLTSGNIPNLINIPSGSGSVFSIENSSPSSTSLQTYFNNNNPTSFPFTLNQPTCLVSVFNSGVVTTYKDGVLVDTKNNSLSSINTASTANLVIGRWGWVFGNAIAGNVYNSSIYSRALSAAEVQQNYNALKGRFGLS